MCGPFHIQVIAQNGLHRQAVGPFIPRLKIGGFLAPFCKTAHFITAMVLGLALTVISVIAQVLYLSNNLDQASIGQGASLLQGLPLIGSLASTATIIVTRALALHVVEFACCYVIARSSVSHRKVMQAMIDVQSEQMLLQIGKQYIAFMQSRLAAGGVDAPALPAANGKPLELPNVTAGSEGASQGNHTFRASQP